MSAILGRLFSRRGKVIKSSNISEKIEDSEIRKHLGEHAVLDNHHGHDHGEEHDHDYIDEKKNRATPFGPPSFVLNLWAVLPLLLLAVGEGIVMILAVLTAIINLLIVHMKAHSIKRYVAAGTMSLIALILYMAV